MERSAESVASKTIATASSDSHKALHSQIAAALNNLGVSAETPIKSIIDETLVGGFVATFDYKEHDQSYKKTLINLYQSITK